MNDRREGSTRTARCFRARAAGAAAGAFFALGLTLSGCGQQEGPAEQAGKKVDEAMENAKETAGEAVDAVKDTASDVAEGAKEAAEDVKEAAKDAADKAKESM